MTSSASISRIVDALSDGKDLCEVILNYRRDGSPFLNLLIIAPLYDSSGRVRFFLGAQIDVNGLYKEGRGLPSLAQLLAKDRLAVSPPVTPSEDGESPNSIEAITELGRLLNDSERNAISKGESRATARYSNGTRRRINAVEAEQYNIKYNSRPGSGQISSGKVVSVFQNYVLVSPHPALRIVFASPSLNSSALINSSLLSRVRGPRKLRQSVESALSTGECFTAKISWLSDISTCSSSHDIKSGLANPSAGRVHADGLMSSLPGASEKAALERSGVGAGIGTGTEIGIGTAGMDEWLANRRISIIRRHSEQHGKLTWMHCTPLFDGKNTVGVWMCVLIRDVGGQDFGELPGDISFHRGERGGSK